MPNTLVHSPQCPNCLRFIDALRRTSVAAQTSLVDVASLSPEQLASITAVPALLTADGQTLYGTKAFEWLAQFQGDVELEGFAGGAGGLAFSDVDSMGYASYTQGFSAFEPPTAE